MPAKPDKFANRIYVLVIWFIFAILAEGILRRWVLPGIGYALVFIRDPILLLIYATAIMGGFVGRNVRPMAVFIMASALYFAVVFIQISATALNPLIPAFGYRTYLLYFPLPFIMYHFLTRKHFESILKLIIVLSVPIGALTAIQYYSGPGSIWNAAPEGMGDITYIDASRVRPYSVFTNSIAHVFFALIALCVFVRFLFFKRALGFPVLMIPIIGLATVTMGALSGARSYFILAPPIIALFMYGAMSGRNVWRGATIAFASAIAVLLVFTAAFFLFPDAVETLINRQNNAVSEEGSTFGRLAFMATDFIRHLSIAQPFGAGAGLGTNIGSYIYAGRRTFAVAEYELTRIVLEFGPTFGLVHIALRLAFVVFLFRKAAEAARRGELLPMALMGVIIPLFTAGPLTTQNSLLSIGWLAAGLSLLACKPTVGDTVAPRPTRAQRKVSAPVAEADKATSEDEDGDAAAAAEPVVEVAVEPVAPPKRGGLVAIQQVIGAEPSVDPAPPSKPRPRSKATPKTGVAKKVTAKPKPKPKRKVKLEPKPAPGSSASAKPRPARGGSSSARRTRSRVRGAPKSK
jgi:hypothetical protein